jgi:hypothetical protein
MNSKTVGKFFILNEQGYAFLGSGNHNLIEHFYELGEDNIVHIPIRIPFVVLYFLVRFLIAHPLVFFEKHFYDVEQVKTFHKNFY